ncbi:LysR substrate-binding domain-containing protein [Photobacterium sp. MCCC 1A19761]|uniref:LysR substrate-binding domain-containing protein n=1 Tax=Photobacterium sp. MCCC 1A19761 TaxID=3115000 RepID=UPI00307E6509
MLALNDEALEALRWIDLQGAVSVGLQEDFSQGILTECLARFSRINDQVQLNIMIERYATLISSVQDASLDVSVTWQGPVETPYSERIADTAIHWIAAPDFPLAQYLAAHQPVPLVVIEPHCLFKQKATAALDAAGVRWQVVYQSQSLSGIWPAVNAGIGITARPRIGCLETLVTVDETLPDLGRIGIQLHRSKPVIHGAGEKLIESMARAIEASYG